MFERRTAGFLLFLAAAGVGGCSGSDSSPGMAQQPQQPENACSKETRAQPFSAGETFTGAQQVTVALMDAAPAPPAQGDNTWTLDVKGPDGNPITDATITAKQLMVDHNHGGNKTIVVTSLGGGSYQAMPVNFSMPGYWENIFEVKTDTLDDKVDVKVCVP
jgi:hypothetical protein